MLRIHMGKKYTSWVSRPILARDDDASVFDNLWRNGIAEASVNIAIFTILGLQYSRILYQMQESIRTVLVGS